MSQTRIAPSEKLAKAVEELVGRVEQEADGAALLGQLAQLGARKLIQEALEAEQAQCLARDRYERREPGSAPLYRNGYERGRLLLGEGTIELQRPQVRGDSAPYRSRIWELVGARSEEVERLVVEMYARGLSTRDIEDLFRGPDGEVLLSKSAVSGITDRLWEEYEAFSRRDLSELPLVYLVVDGVYEAMRRLGPTRDGLLVAWGILEDGQRVLLHLELGNRESYESCLAFLRGMKARGLKDPVLVTSDGAPGMIQAIEEAFALALRQRCLVHKKRNVLDKVPEDEKAAVAAFLNAIYHAPTLEIARSLATEFAAAYQGRFPSAVRSFLDDLEACLAQLRCPEVHRRAIRTTNIIERAFEELRRRTKVIPRFFDEKSCLKLAYAELVRAGQRSRRVRMSEIELRQLQLLRRELSEQQSVASPPRRPPRSRETAA
ncbi:MAG: IS256 family transposase [Thermomicrobiales bacterium]